MKKEGQEGVIRAFKQTIAKEMGKTSCSLIALQTLPIAWQTAEAMGWNPYKFCRQVGYSDHLLESSGYISKANCVCEHAHSNHRDASAVGMGQACTKCNCDDYWGDEEPREENGNPTEAKQT